MSVLITSTVAAAMFAPPTTDAADYDKTVSAARNAHQPIFLYVFDSV